MDALLSPEILDRVGSLGAFGSALLLIWAFLAGRVFTKGFVDELRAAFQARLDELATQFRERLAEQAAHFKERLEEERAAKKEAIELAKDMATQVERMASALEASNRLEASRRADAAIRRDERAEASAE